jgi:hypothetical protein
MNKVLLFSLTCLIFSSVVISQSSEDSQNEYSYSLNVPDSILKKMLKQRPGIDSLFNWELPEESLKIYRSPDCNNFGRKGLYRFYTMPEYSVKGKFTPVMPEYHADSKIACIMPEVKFPGLIKDKSRIPKHLAKYKRDD